MKDFLCLDIGSSDCRAEDGAQTRDPQLGRLVLYQLSYFRNILFVGFSPRLTPLSFRLSVGRDGFEPPKP